jgi:hypothetical protein
MSGVTNVRLTSEAGITDIEFIGGGIVKIVQRASARSKPFLSCDLKPKPEFAKGKGTLIGTIVTAIGTGVNIDQIGTVVFY